MSSTFVHTVAVAGLALAAGGAVLPAAAQAVGGQTRVAAAPAGNVAWGTLTAGQKEALQPLAAAWPGLTDAQQRKWLAISQNYAQLGLPEREKMQRRMLDWAALNPKEREQARLNFSQAKSIPASDRAANWEAYQALSPEERQRLAEKAANKPAGAAVTVKPVPANKLAPIPVTRHTPEEKRSEQVAKRPLDQNTLLPKAGGDSPEPGKP